MLSLYKKIEQGAKHGLYSLVQNKDSFFYLVTPFKDKDGDYRRSRYADSFEDTLYVDFGYKVQEKAIVYKVVDFGNIKQFIHKAQIDAVKAFSEELQPFLYEYPGVDGKESGHNEAVQEIKQAINNLLKDI